MRKIFVILLFLCLGITVQAADDPPAANRPLKMDRDIMKTVQPNRTLQFKPVTAVRIQKPVFKKLKNLRPILPEAELQKPEGPDPAATLDLSDVIEDPDLLADLGWVCGWDSHLILQDKAAAHVFYYVPRAFLIKRDADGYRLNVQYNTRAEAGAPSVMLTAELQAPHRPGDVHLLKSILRQAFDLKAPDNLRIKALPGLGATADLQALATGLTLPAERIHLSPPAHLKQVFRLTLSLTQDEAEEVLAQIAHDGLAGRLNVPVEESRLPIPIRIQYSRFAGLCLEGIDAWAKGKPISALANVTDFPVRLEAINAYRMDRGRLERLSKQLKPVRIAPGTDKSLKLPASSRLLGDNLMVVWMGLELERDCADCIAAIDRSIRKGVALAPGSRIHLEAIPSMFDEFGVYKLIVHVQTPYFTAQADQVQKKEVTLTVDANENEALMLFVPSDKGPDPLLYKYRVEAILESGENRMAPHWEDARKLTQFFGSSQLQALFNEAAE